jgi:hypothetical protein
MTGYRLFATAIVLAYLGLCAASCYARAWREAVIAALFAASNTAIFLWR